MPTRADGRAAEPDGSDDVWKALSNPTRRRMLDVLFEGPASTGELAEHFPDLSRFAVMQHLGVLEQADLVVTNKVGRRRINHLNPVPIQQISDRWIDRYRQPLADALLSLKDLVEADGDTATTTDRRPVHPTETETETKQGAS